MKERAHDDLAPALPGHRGPGPPRVALNIHIDIIRQRNMILKKAQRAIEEIA